MTNATCKKHQSPNVITTINFFVVYYKHFNMKKVLLTLLFAIIGIVRLSAQADSIISFFQHEQSLLREKLYLHTDKPYYSAGDTIWFRGTLVNAETLSYNIQTNFIYVELLSATDSLVCRRKVKREGVCFHHSIPLEMTLNEGYYYLRGYSEWMLNFGDTFVFEKKISICNNLKNASSSFSLKERDYHVDFLPEGGHLLAGTKQVVAFKALRNDGYSEDVRGFICNEKGDTLSHFSTLHAGMGTVVIDVPTNGRLIAHTIASDNHAKEVALPDIQQNGFALSVGRSNDSLKVRINTCNEADSLHGKFRLIVHSEGFLQEHCEVHGYEHVFSTEEWLDGVNQILLCDTTGKVMSRRLVFTNNLINKEEWSMSVEGATSDKRQRVRLDFELHDEKGEPLLGDFSISVTDAKVIEPDTLTNDIISHLLLTSTLNGTIEAPAWYFHQGTNRMKELDLVMLTHGWCGFKTDNLARNNEYDLPYFIENMQYISGRIEGGLPNSRKVFVSTYNTYENRLILDRVNSDGTFCLKGLEFIDSTYFNVRIVARGNANKRIYFDKIEYPKSTYKHHNFRLKGIDYKPIRKYFPSFIGYMTYVLPELEVKESRRSKFAGMRHSWYASAWNENELLKLCDSDMATVLDFVNNLIKSSHAGLIFGYGCADFQDGVNHERGAVWGPLQNAYLDYNTYSGYEQLYNIFSRICLYDVERIEIHKGTPSEYWERHSSSFSSTICIGLKKGRDLMRTPPNRRQHFYFPKGFDWPAYFYHPKYEVSTPGLIEDKRTTVYWNPSVQTDKEGKCSIVFFTSDSPNQYHIEVEGVTFNGRVCRKSISIN